MNLLEEAKHHLATYGAAHTECCGTPLIRKLVAELELLQRRAIRAKILITDDKPETAKAALDGTYDNDR